MNEHVIEIGGKRYIAQTASAKNQFEVFPDVVASGIFKVFEEGANDVIVGMIVSGMGVSKVREIERLLVTGYVTTDESIPVADNLFTDNIQDYFSLIGRVIEVNLMGFIRLLKANTKGETQEQQ